MLICLGLAIILAALLRKMMSPDKPASADWVERFSVERYRPMERLLDERDFVFLASQPGYEPSMKRRLRAARRKAFRGYLRGLRRDFGRLYGAVNLLLVHAPEDRPELAATLLKQRAMFQWGVMLVEGRLLLHACGIGAVDVRGLLGVLDSMRLEVRQLSTAGAAA
ncbi:MAG: hypothetical protein ACE15B_12445 [Bryobacteraceae bacterium]